MKLTIDLDKVDADYDGTAVAEILADAIRGAVQTAVRAEVAAHKKALTAAVKRLVGLTLEEKHLKAMVAQALKAQAAKLEG